MSISLSAIQINNLQIVKSFFEASTVEDDLDFDNRVSIGFEFSDLVQEDEGFKRLEAKMLFASHPKNDQSNSLSSEVIARGIFFGMQGDTEEDEDFWMFMKVNAYSLLYGFIRNHICQISSMSPIGQINLPCIDVQSITESLRDSDNNESESDKED